MTHIKSKARTSEKPIQANLPSLARICEDRAEDARPHELKTQDQKLILKLDKQATGMQLCNYV
jgi:hypothetical protein